MRNLGALATALAFMLGQCQAHGANFLDRYEWWRAPGDPFLLTPSPPVAGFPQPKPVIKLDGDAGGVLAAYWTRFRIYAAKNYEVEITSYCLSACTLITGALAKSKLCFGPYARLGFHQAMRPGVERFDF